MRPALWPTAVGLSVLYILLCAAACSESGVLIPMHLSNERRQQAESEWKSIRAGVKLQLATQRFQAGRIEEAKRHLLEALELNPREPSAYVLLAKLELREGRLGMAEQAISTANSLPNAGPEADYVAGVIAERYGRLDEAAAHYLRAAEKQPGEAEYLLACGEMLVALNRPAEALWMVERRLADLDQDVGLWMFLAETHRLLGLTEGAIAAYREVVRLSQPATVARAQLGLLLVEARHYMEAIEVLQPLVDEAKSKKSSAIRTTSVHDRRQGETAEPRETTPPLPLIGESPGIRRALARARLETGRPDMAMAIVSDLLYDNPNDAEGLMLMARIALVIDRPEMLSKTVRLLQQVKPITSDVRLLEAYAAFARGDFIGCANAVREVVRTQPENVPAWWLLARLAREAGQFQESYRALEEAMHLAPENVSMRRMYDEWLLADGEHRSEAAAACAPAALDVPASMSHSRSQDNAGRHHRVASPRHDSRSEDRTP
jgi:Tfp pilus assembly protein PilF